MEITHRRVQRRELILAAKRKIEGTVQKIKCSGALYHVKCVVEVRNTFRISRGNPEGNSLLDRSRCRL